MELSSKFLGELQRRLKIGNRRGVHLNAIPAKSGYKFDISRLAYIDKMLPDNFVNSLLTEQPMKFRISWKNNVPDLNKLQEEEQSQLVRITRSFENLISQTETIESEKGINTFGFGFPILVRRDQADNQLTVAPVLIWSLRVKRTKEFNTWEITRTEDDPIYINEVLINHLLNDAQVEVPQISEEMLEDGIIDRRELIDICVGLIEGINTTHNDNLREVFAQKLQNVVSIKDKKHYEGLPITSNNALLEFGGIFSIFEVQKQNIINDYDQLMELEGCVIGQDDLEGNHFQPLSSVETDPSQQSILNALGTKRNIVIQGPPGTGKSQSLTAVLVNALENNKKTIVVCEKRTALEVLQQALNARGQKYNCVLIKDIVKDRKTVVDSVRDRIDNNPFGYRSYHYQHAKESLDELTGKATRLIEAINDKHLKLDRRLLANKNWTTIVGELLKEKRKSNEEINLTIEKDRFVYNASELSVFMELVEKGQQFWKTYAPHQSTSFLNSEQLIGANPYKVEQQINDDYSDYQLQHKTFSNAVAEYRKFYGNQRATELKAQFEKIDDLIQLMTKISTLTALVNDFRRHYLQVRNKETEEQIKDINIQISNIQKYISEHRNEKHFTDEKKTRSLFYKLAMLFSEKRRQTLAHQQELQNQFNKLATFSLDCGDLRNFVASENIVGNISACEKLQDHLTHLKENLNELLHQQFESLNLATPVQDAYSNELADAILIQSGELCELLRTNHHNQFLQAAEQHIVQILGDCKDLNIKTEPSDAFDALSRINREQITATHLQSVENEFVSYNLLDNSIPYYSDYPNQLTTIAYSVNEKIQNNNWTKKAINVSSEKDFLESLQTIIDEKETYFSHKEDIFTAEFNWFNFYNGLDEKNKPIIDNLKSCSNWKRSFLIFYLNSLLVNGADGNLPVGDQEHDELKDSLDKIDKEQMQYIREYWYSHQIQQTREFERRNPNLSVENLYNKRSSQRYQRLSLRMIVQYDPDLFTSFFPIILTTPDVCSNLFRGMNGYFDLVIFDEASQLRLEDNLPAVLKGRQVVVAGDEHQMPPSNYFSRILEGEIEDEEDVEEDENIKIDKDNLLLSCESLLDFATELGFEKRYLDFHYRSRHPYLIDFSNYAFYNQRLQPIPNDFEYIPISYQSINGTFSDHTNEKEADAVLAILEHNIHRLPNGEYPSVGVATFNITQRNLIKSKIRERQKFEKYSEFNDKISELEQNGFFVKNLENIQGDERDVIILSTTYGKNKDGKFLHRFGPITQSKGYKLLNVIITRAKYKVYVCSSIPEDVFLNYKEYLHTEGSNNKRAVFFAYMAYAKSVSENDPEARRNVLAALAENTTVSRASDSFNNDLESPFEEEVYAALCDHFEPEYLLPQFPFAGFRIDLVFDSKITGKPRIAIECDGANYHSSQEAYLHDLYRQKILEEHGFQFHRIWSTNWWRNSKRETNRLVEFINQIINSDIVAHPLSESFANAFTADFIEIERSKDTNPENSDSIIDLLKVKEKSPIQSTLFDESIRKGSFATLKYLNNDKVITIKIVTALENRNENADGIQRISSESPLGKSLIGSVKGDIVRVGNLDNYVQVLEVKG